ncbi:hypothetical protein BCR34DRAFT_597802 [Clohesyomyces aquaticus]|uniref:Uncharacterized protein n=1 Tax=Clohesyomyces aquaticus TaxID=1231657 RepID=A0A1Y2A1R8_9PLEO|nr:hypothetical protein BCR34DRAFT_597802 [Clohesyomyces aquaticus]
MEWKLVANAVGAPSLTREHTPETDTLDVGVASTVLSVEDIINYCQSMGLRKSWLGTDFSSSGESTALGLTFRTCAKWRLEVREYSWGWELPRPKSKIMFAISFLSSKLLANLDEAQSFSASMGYAQEYVFDTNLTSSNFLGHTPSTADGDTAGLQA